MFKSRIIFLGLVLAIPLGGLYGQNQPVLEHQAKEPRTAVSASKAQQEKPMILEEISAYDWARMTEAKRLEILAQPERFRLAKDAMRKLSRAALAKLTQDEAQHLRDNPSLYFIVD